MALARKVEITKNRIIGEQLYQTAGPKLSVDILARQTLTFGKSTCGGTAKNRYSTAYTRKCMPTNAGAAISRVVKRAKIARPTSATSGGEPDQPLVFLTPARYRSIT